MGDEGVHTPRLATSAKLGKIRRGRLHSLVGTNTLTPTTSRFTHLLALLNRRLHVVPAPLQLAENTFSSHAALQVLDGTFDALVANGDFKGLALDGLVRVRQGAGDMTFCAQHCNPPKARNSRASAESYCPMNEQLKLTPTGVKAPHGASELEISWGDGHRNLYSHTVLRGFCPCAACQGHSGEITFQSGGNVELRGLERVGNYALGLTWGDGHNSGIFSFRYLRRLGELLEEHGAVGLETLGRIGRV